MKIKRTINTLMKFGFITNDSVRRQTITGNLLIVANYSNIYEFNINKIYFDLAIKRQ